MKAQFLFIIQHYKLSQQELSEKLGVSKSTISHIISGRNKPGLEMIQAIHEQFNEINLKWLLTLKGKPLIEITTETSILDINQIKLSQIAEELKKLEYSIDLTHRELQHQLKSIKDKI